jgi:hypothetical protein
MNPKITYIDIMTKQRRWTRKEFTGWQRGGILNVPGAVFAGKNGFMWIPIYLLTRESLAILPPHPLLTPQDGNE